MTNDIKRNVTYDELWEIITDIMMEHGDRHIDGSEEITNTILNTFEVLHK